MNSCVWEFAKRLFEGIKERFCITLTPDRHGYVAAPVARWFNGYKTSVVANDKRKVFHSLRHNFRSTVRCAQVSQDVAICCHSKQDTYLNVMPANKKRIEPPELIHEWPLPVAATLGSMVRTKGIMLEMRARLPAVIRKHLDLRPGLLILGMPKGAEDAFAQTCDLITRNLVDIENLPVIPREIQDILSISATERHRWLKDGRLQSAGTRTVKLHGRAKKITFHVFDPKMIEDMLDGDKMTEWREADRITAAENRRQAAWKRRLAQEQKAQRPIKRQSKNTPNLAGWAEFERDGPLR
jgi:hypothetical protein